MFFIFISGMKLSCLLKEGLWKAVRSAPYHFIICGTRFYRVIFSKKVERSIPRISSVGLGLPRMQDTEK